MKKLAYEGIWGGDQKDMSRQTPAGEPRQPGEYRQAGVASHQLTGALMP